MPAWIKRDFVDHVGNFIENSIGDEIVSVFEKLKEFCARVPGIKDPGDMADERPCVWIRCRKDMGSWNGDDDGPYDRLVERMSESLSRVWGEYVPTKQSKNEIRDL